jgi:hypothetical protein
MKKISKKIKKSPLTIKKSSPGREGDSNDIDFRSLYKVQ